MAGGKIYLKGPQKTCPQKQTNQTKGNLFSLGEGVVEACRSVSKYVTANVDKGINVIGKVCTRVCRGTVGCVQREGQVQSPKPDTNFTNWHEAVGGWKAGRILNWSYAVEKGVQLRGSRCSQAVHVFLCPELKRRLMQIKQLPKSIRPPQDGSGTASKI